RYGAPGPVVESRAWMVKLNEPACVGMPERTPEPDRVRPAGRTPLAIVKRLYGAVPPWPVSVWLYGAPAAASGRVAGVKEITGALTVSAWFWRPVYGAAGPVVESWARMVKLKLPTAVGVPLRKPLPESVSSVRPAGSAPALIVKLPYGAVPPAAVSVWL